MSDAEQPSRPCSHLASPRSRDRQVVAELGHGAEGEGSIGCGKRQRPLRRWKRWFGDLVVMTAHSSTDGVCAFPNT